MLLALLIVFFCFAHQPCLGDPKFVEAWHVRQKHYFFGESDLTFSKDAIRIDCSKQLKFALVAKAPTWQVTVFRQDDKTYFDESLKQLTETGLVSSIIIGFRDNYLLKELKPVPVKVSGFDAWRVSQGRISLTYMDAPKGVAPQISQVLYGAYKMPTNGQIPLQHWSRSSGRDLITEMKEAGIIKTFLTTISISQVSVPISLFDPPKGYRRVKRMSEVVLSEQARDSSNDLDVLFRK
ncbi:MAG TPA: hypothetical protein V6C86_03690 [Oculatellaceae cyanobacterium]